MVEQQEGQKIYSQQLVMPEIIKEFDNAYNIQQCILRCIYSSAKPEEFVPSVALLELTLVSDLSSDVQKELDKLTDNFGNNQDLNTQYSLAREKYRVLYGFVKKKSPVRVVLAIGRPICPVCKTPIKWNRDEKEKKEPEPQGVEKVV